MNERVCVCVSMKNGKVKLVCPVLQKEVAWVSPNTCFSGRSADRRTALLQHSVAVLEREKVCSEKFVGLKEKGSKTDSQTHQQQKR